MTIGTRSHVVNVSGGHEWLAVSCKTTRCGGKIISFAVEVVAGYTSARTFAVASAYIQLQ